MGELVELLIPQKLSENDISAGYRVAIGCGQPDFILEESQAWTPFIRAI
jgi:hypothetical protein